MSSLNILVVDDEPFLGQLVADELRVAGYDVITAASGNEALNLVKNRNDIDLVLSDIRMADGDGMYLLRQIKAHSQEKPRMIFMTGFSYVTLAEAYDEGCEAIFNKPIDFDALLAFVSKLAHPKITETGRRKSERYILDNNFEIVFSLGDQLIRKALGNIGRGGMFLDIKGDLPKVGENIQFTIIVRGELAFHIEGTAICRWVQYEEVPEQKRGAGFEFTGIKPQSLDNFYFLINQLNTKAHIPKS